MTQTVKNLPAMQEIRVQSLGWEDPLEKGMATDSSILAWRVPWTEELAGYSSCGRKELDTTERLTDTQARRHGCGLVARALDRRQWTGEQSE